MRNTAILKGVEMKKVNARLEFSSIFYDSKWLDTIEIFGFSSRKPKQNEAFLKKIGKVIKDYNK